MSQLIERVTLIQGKNPILWIAPHNHQSDDFNTGEIAKSAAKATNSFGIINNGWKRGADYNYNSELCDCNDLRQLVDVPYDEFLEPILRFKTRILRKNGLMHMICIHGCSNNVRNVANDSDLGIIVGWGNGKPNSHTCDEWMKNLFCFLASQYGWGVYEGKAGSNYAAWSKNNLCQLFRKTRPEPLVHAMQLEIVRDWRSDTTRAQFTGECIGECINEIRNYGDWHPPTGFQILQY